MENKMNTEEIIKAIEDKNYTAIAPAFKGTVDEQFLLYRGAEEDLRPDSFQPADKFSATHFGVNIQDESVSIPIFFGIRVSGDKSFLINQADGIVQNFFSISSHNKLKKAVGWPSCSKEVASLGMAYGAILHSNVGVVNKDFIGAEKGANQPEIDPANIPLFDALSSAMAKTAAELHTNGKKSANIVWQKELDAIRAQHVVNAPAAASNVVLFKDAIKPKDDGAAKTHVEILAKSQDNKLPSLPGKL